MIKLIDFGLASHFPIDPLLKCGGALNKQYINSENVADESFEENIDVFTAVALIYYLLRGELPFTGDEYEHEVEQLIGEFKTEKRKWKDISI